jgi:hypothetical protein
MCSAAVFSCPKFFTNIKGQIKPKADWHAVDSPKKRTNDFFLFYSSWQKQTNSFVRFLGESTVRKSAYSFI